MALDTDRERVAHLLRRFGLGASEAEVDHYSRDGWKGAVDRLLDFESVDEGFAVPIDAMQTDQGRINMPGVVSWWILRLLLTRRPLQEKMTLFWHDHFATSASKVLQPLMMYKQNETLRAGALGRFPDLLKAVAEDPAMIFWLDGQLNQKGKPNENFAREVMELFTLGIGHYTEKDVQEAARAFTGYGIRRSGRGVGQRGTPMPAFGFNPGQHDDGPKTILGRTGNFSGDDVLQMLVAMPRTSEHLVTKIWEWFVYPNPEKSVVDRFARVYRDSGLDTKTLLRSIMLSSEFYSRKAERAVYKNPVDFVVPCLRQLGVGSALRELAQDAASTRVRGLGPIAVVNQSMRGMGMQLLYPPDVAGWDGGAAWVTSATMVERIGLADRLFSIPAPGQARTRRASLRIPAGGLLAGATPAQAAERLVSLFDAPVPPSALPKLVEAAQKESGGAVTAQNANAVAQTVTRLIFAMPSFQFA